MRSKTGLVWSAAVIVIVGFNNSQVGAECV